MWSYCEKFSMTTQCMHFYVILACLLHLGAVYAGHDTKNSALGELVVRLDDDDRSQLYTSYRRGIIACIMSCI